MRWARSGRRRRRYRCPYLVVPDISMYFADLYAGQGLKDAHRTRAEMQTLQQVALRVHQAMGWCRPVVTQNGQVACPYQDMVNAVVSYAFMPSGRSRYEVYPDPVAGDVPSETPATPTSDCRATSFSGESRDPAPMTTLY
jgi:hypothetical protein